jgi:hypothetical protein
MFKDYSPIIRTMIFFWIAMIGVNILYIIKYILLNDLPITILFTLWLIIPVLNINYIRNNYKHL